MSTAAAPSRAPLFVGVGCVGCLGLICVGSVVAFFGERGLVGMSASSHAVRFLQTVERRDYAEAYEIALSRYDTDRTRVADFTTCLGATPLGTMTSFLCSDSDVTLDQRRAEVTCTITTPAGTTEVTLDVSDPVEHPYNGFVWFSPDGPWAPRGTATPVRAGRAVTTSRSRRRVGYVRRWRSHAHAWRAGTGAARRSRGRDREWDRRDGDDDLASSSESLRRRRRVHPDAGAPA